MPAIIYTLDDLLLQHQEDLYVLAFNLFLNWREEANAKTRRNMLAWLEQRKIDYVTAAPKGWLEGDPAQYAVFFDGPDDPRLHEYQASFEDEHGLSLQPSIYQMHLIPCRLPGEVPESAARNVDHAPFAKNV